MLPIILFILGAVVSIVVTYFIVKLAVFNAIVETQRIGNPPNGLDRIIKRAILEAAEESKAVQQEILYRAVKNAIKDAAQDAVQNIQTEGSAT